MVRFGLGILLGIVLTLLGFVLLSIRPQTQGRSVIDHFQPTTQSTGAAGLSSNYAQTVDAKYRFHLSLALADQAPSTASASTDLINLEITIAKLEVHLTDPVDHWEILNVSQPTIELFSLHGSSAIADLGSTDLARGGYQAIRLTLSSIKGKRSTGQVVDVTFGEAGPQLELQRTFQWQTSGKDIQLVLDLDTNRSITQQGKDYFFSPKMRRLIQNDQEI